MKNVRFVLLIVALVFLSGFLSPSFADNKRETAYERVIRTGVLRCGYGIFEPQTMKDPNTGAFTGAFVDVMQSLGKELGIKVEYTEEVDWGQIAEALSSGRIDAFCPGMWGTAKRGAHIAFTKPVYYSTLEAFVRADDKRFDNNKAAINNENVTLATNEGDVTDEIADRFFPKAKRFAKGAISGEAYLLINVETRKADVTFTAPSIAATYMRGNPGKLRQVVLPQPILVYPNVIGVDIHEYELVSMLNAGITQLENNGLIAEILGKYPDGKFFRLPSPAYQ